MTVVNFGSEDYPSANGTMRAIMLICRSIPQIRDAVATLRASGGSVGLVTTMGALHAGHMSLVSHARADHDHVVATIFVNPTQFGNPDDLLTYPKTEDSDLAMLRDAGASAVYLPDASEIYPDGAETIVETTRLANMLHGLVRPGHFRGVATVVCKLFNIIGADAAYFGEKDYQQLQVIRRMVADLFMPITIHGVPTVREPDGLAMSSRNVRLTPQDRAAAVCLNKALTRAQEAARNGATVEAMRDLIAETINAEPRARLRAIDIAEALTLAPVTGHPAGDIGIMISAEFGPDENPVLLIDQREIRK